MASYVELYMDQGATFNTTINLQDDTTNANINVVGYTVRSQIRRSYYSANITANIVCTITDGPNGAISMTVPASNTSNIRPGRYLFDLETETAAGVVVRVLEGIINVTPGVTR